jgi:hypothetical protein
LLLEEYVINVTAAYNGELNPVKSALVGSARLVLLVWCNCSGDCGGRAGLLLEEYVVTVTAAYNGEWLRRHMVYDASRNCSGVCGGGAGLLLEEYVVTVTAACNGKWLPACWLLLGSGPEPNTYCMILGCSMSTLAVYIIPFSAFWLRSSVVYIMRLLRSMWWGRWAAA